MSNARHKTNSNVKLKTLAFLFLLIISGEFFGQETWSMDQFILTSTSNQTMKYQDEKLNLLENDNYRLSVVERLEFRTETNDFELAQQKYAFRLTTNSFKEINATQDLYQSEKELNRIHKEVLLKNELMNRYNIIISMVFLKDKLKIVNSELNLYEAKLKILKKIAIWDLVKVKDLIETEEDYQSADIKRISLENDLLSLQTKISEICQKEVSINTDDLIAPRFIQEHYREIIDQDTTVNSEVQSLNTELKQLHQEQTVEQSKNKKLVRYYQIGYDGRNKAFEQDQLTIGIGFLLPVGGSTKRKLAELKYDELELKSDYESAVQNMKLDRYDVIVDLKNNIKQYEILNAHYEQSLAIKTLEKYNEIPEISALSIIALKEFDLSQKQKLLASEFILYKNYLESIEVFDLINPSAFQNYLSIRHFGY